MTRNLSFYHPRMPGLVEIDPVVLEKKRKMLKVYTQTLTKTDSDPDDLEKNAKVTTKTSLKRYM